MLVELFQMVSLFCGTYNEIVFPVVAVDAHKSNQGSWWHPLQLPLSPSLVNKAWHLSNSASAYNRAAVWSAIKNGVAGKYKKRTAANNYCQTQTVVYYTYTLKFINVYVKGTHSLGW